jgi:hypothetical protein
MGISPAEAVSVRKVVFMTRGELLEQVRAEATVRRTNGDPNAAFVLEITAAYLAGYQSVLEQSDILRSVGYIRRRNGPMDTPNLQGLLDEITAHLSAD